MFRLRPETPMGMEHSGISKSAEATEASVTRPPYVPQFSTATSLILQRIKRGSQSFDSALSAASAIAPPDQEAYEDARARLVQSMNTTMAMPPRPSQSIHGMKTPVSSSKLEGLVLPKMDTGLKRKRDSISQSVDFTQNTMVMPPPRSRSQEPHSALMDSGRKDGLAQAIDPMRQAKIEKIRQKRLASLPEGVTPAKPEIVGFGPGAASDYARTEYFYNMKKTDILNLLSFCDQLKPQLLVDLMVSVTKRHPDLPIFDSPDWDAHIPEPRIPKYTSHKLGGKLGRSRHGPSLLNSKAKGKIKTNVPRSALKKAHKRSRLAEEITVPEEESHMEGIGEDAPPPTWPKPGEGLYAKLVPETEDRLFLADDNDEEAFSHFMVDKMGRQIVDPV